MPEDFASLIAELKENETLAAVEVALEAGTRPLEIVEGLRRGMSVVGMRFENGEFYFSEMVMSAEIFVEAIALIGPHMEAGDIETKGQVIVGTVQGDIHDIGKNIVATMLRCNGFRVHDLGVDVSPDAFIAKAKETGAGLLGLSGLLTFAFDAMKATVDLVAESGLEDTVKVMIGGAQVNERVVDYTGADAFREDASQAVKLANRFLGE